MADSVYRSIYTGVQIDEAIGTVLNSGVSAGSVSIATSSWIDVPSSETGKPGKKKVSVKNGSGSAASGVVYLGADKVMNRGQIFGFVMDDRLVYLDYEYVTPVSSSEPDLVLYSNSAIAGTLFLGVTTQTSAPATVAAKSKKSKEK